MRNPTGNIALHVNDPSYRAGHAHVRFWTSAGGPTLAGTAWQTTYDWMVGATLTAPCAVADSLWTCGLALSGGAAAEAIWDASKSCANGSCGTRSVSVDAKWRHYQDITGATYTIRDHAVPVGIKPLLLQ